MSRTKRPRKAYRPRLAAIPVMPELLREFEYTLRLNYSWMVASKQVTSPAPLDALAHAFNVLIVAHPELMKGPVIEGYARAMSSLIERQVKAGAVTLNEFDAATLVVGVNRMIEVVVRADVSRMYLAIQKLRRAA